MKIVLTKNVRYQPEYLLRKCGYGKHVSPQGELSYVRILGRTEFPRFHAYAEPHGDGALVTVHLDQKRPTYGEGTAHSGEYDGDTVEREVTRIKQIIQQLHN